MPATTSTPTPAAPAAAPRRFGRFELRRLLGKSEATMTWLAFDPRLGGEVMLTMPRVQPGSAEALAQWQDHNRLANRLDHPHLAAVGETGVQDHWPFVAVDRALGLTLDEHLAAHAAPTPVQVADWMVQALGGLAFAHEAGVTHGDLQLHNLLLAEDGTVRLMALAVAVDLATAEAGPSQHDRALAVDTGHLRARRAAGERDVLAASLLLLRMLAGQPALDEPDPARVARRMPPHGHDIVRLPRSTPFPVAEPLRAIVNRATSSHERQRYLNARTLQRALDGWRASEAHEKGGPLELLLERLRSVGHLPTGPGITERIGRVSGMEGQRTDELAAQLLQDTALALELLRQVNASQAASDAPVLTIRRTIALLGLNGVRRAVTGLRPWPGPLHEAGAAALARLIERVQLAAYAAQALRPAGYDPEVMYLVALLQNLGRLLVQYHFPEEAEQIWQLMRPAAPEPGQESAGTPGMDEVTASSAVLGIDTESLGLAVARHWGLGDEMLAMMRRLPADRPARTASGDGEALRTAASAANEAVDAMALTPAAGVGRALAAVAQRYARALEIGPRELQEALQGARAALRGGGVAAAVRPGDHAPEPEPEPEPEAQAKPDARTGSLRERSRAAAQGGAA